MEFPGRIYTDDEVSLAKALIDGGYKHRLRIVGSPSFKEKTRQAIELIKTAGDYDFLRRYIRTIREIEGLSQLREAEASLWTNAYTVSNPVSAAGFFIQKAWQMKNYIQGEEVYGHRAEKKAVDARLRFLEVLGKRTGDPKIREECLRKVKTWNETEFL